MRPIGATPADQRLCRGPVSVRDIYERTKQYRSYCQSLIPGLLQTPEYTTAVLESLRDRRQVPVDDVAIAVAERMDRQHILYEGDHTCTRVLAVSELVSYRPGEAAS